MSLSISVFLTVAPHILCVCPRLLVTVLDPMGTQTLGAVQG